MPIEVPVDEYAEACLSKEDVFAELRLKLGNKLLELFHSDDKDFWGVRYVRWLTDEAFRFKVVTAMYNDVYGKQMISVGSMRDVWQDREDYLRILSLDFWPAADHKFTEEDIKKILAAGIDYKLWVNESESTYDSDRYSKWQEDEHFKKQVVDDAYDYIAKAEGWTDK